jgi:hypothetical protein
MKTSCLLFLMIGCAALTSGTSCAAQSSPASQQPPSESPANTISDHPRDAVHGTPVEDGGNQNDGKPSDEQRDYRHASDQDHPRSRASLTRSNRPKQVPNNGEHSTSGTAMNLHQPGSDKSGASARGALIQHETFNRALTIRPASIRPRVPLPNNVRHRGANPAIIGGSASSNSRNTGAIDGAHMNRRP